jgi:hypothetical protein
MKDFFKKSSFKAFLLITAFLSLLVFEEVDAQRRGGGSFGGRRGGGSFGKSRSAPSYRTQPRTTTTPRTTPRTTTTRPTVTQPRTSFGGTRLSSPTAYTQRYGTPRRTQTVTRQNAQGQPQNYVVHQYGGMGDRFMTGYMLGSIPWMWSMPFHPAFYYSRPQEYKRPDGTTEVYPPTFSWGKFFFTMLIIAAVIYVLYAILRSRKRAQMSETFSRSSFS